jgi:ABC-type transport system substrate-binding protein
MEQFRSTATPNPNLFGYSDERVDALLARLGMSPDRAAINQLCRDVETVVNQAPPAAWLYNETHTFIASRRLSGFGITGNNHWLLGDVRSEP